MSELEEIEREDNFRLKRFKELKYKKNDEKDQDGNKNKKLSDHTCPACKRDNPSVRVPSKSNVSHRNVCSVGEGKTDMLKKEVPCVTIVARDLNKSVTENISITADRNTKSDAEKFTCSVCISENVTLQSDQGDLGYCTNFRKEKVSGSNSKGDLEKLSTQIDEIITLIDDCKAQGLVSQDVDDFVYACLEAKSKISNKNSKTSNVSLISGKFKKPDLLNKEIGHFETKYKEIVKVTRTPNVDGTICEEKQTITVKTVRSIPCTKDATNKPRVDKLYNDDYWNKENSKKTNVTRESKSENFVKTEKPGIRKSVSADAIKKPRDKPISNDFSVKNEKSETPCMCPLNISQTASAESTKSCQTKSPSSAPSFIVSRVTKGYSEANSILVRKTPSSPLTKSNGGYTHTEDTQNTTETRPQPIPHNCQSTHSSVSQSSQRSQQSDSTSKSYYNGSAKTCYRIKIVAKPGSSTQKPIRNEIAISASTMSILTKLLSQHSRDTCRKSNKLDSITTTRNPSQEALVPEYKEDINGQTTPARKISNSKISRKQNLPILQSLAKNSKQKTGKCLTAKASTESNKSKNSCCETSMCAKMNGQKCSCAKKDGSTQTRRSDKYDVRPLNMFLLVDKKCKECNCHSDTQMLKYNKLNALKPVCKSWSMH